MIPQGRVVTRAGYGCPPTAQRRSLRSCLINFLDTGDVLSESELILMGPEAKCFFLERGQFKTDDKGVIKGCNELN